MRYCDVVTRPRNGEQVSIMGILSARERTQCVVLDLQGKRQPQNNKGDLEREIHRYWEMIPVQICRQLVRSMLLGYEHA